MKTFSAMTSRINFYCRPFSVAIIVVIAASTHVHSDLVSHWRFNESPGAIVAEDAASSFDGTLLGGATFVNGGIDGNAVSLNSSNSSLVDMGYGFPAFTNGDFSLSAWVNTTTTDDHTIVLGRHLHGSVNGYGLNLNSTPGYGSATKAWFYGSNNPGQEVISTTTVNDGSWHQIVSVYEQGVNQAIYVDGIPFEDVTAAQEIHDLDPTFLVGGIDVAGIPTAYFTGLIDDVQVYDHALNNEQISFLFANPGQAIPEPSSFCLLTLLGTLLFRRNKDLKRAGN